MAIRALGTHPGVAFMSEEEIGWKTMARIVMIFETLHWPIPETLDEAINVLLDRTRSFS